MAAFRHRFTLRQTQRTVPIMFSIELVQASDRLSLAGRPRRSPQADGGPLGAAFSIRFLLIQEAPCEWQMVS